MSQHSKPDCPAAPVLPPGVHLIDRISRDEMYMQMAEVAAKRSTCSRAHVGVVITNLDRTSVVSVGYNGNARGLPDHCDSTTPGDCGCIHAEVNSLIKAPYGPELVMYTTTCPCPDCAKLILNSSVKFIFYRRVYRKTEGATLLRTAGISLHHLEVPV